MPSETHPDPQVLDRMIKELSGLLAELGACPPIRTTCPQRGKPINITICSKCIVDWAKAKACGD